MEQDNLNQLKKLAKVFNTDNVITSDEIEQVLSGILSIMSSFKKDNENLTKETRDYVNELLDKVIEEKNILKSDTEVKANEISKDVQAKLDSKLEEVKKLIKEAKALKPKNGKDADQVKIVKDVLSQIKLPEYKPTLLDTPEEIKNKLETLTGDERLDISAIKGADKLATQANLERGISILDQRTQFLINKTNSSSGSSITLKTNDVDNGSQSILNLKQGANITLTDDGVGGVTIDAAGGSGTPGGSTTQLQYNNAGSFGGISGVTTNGTAVTFTGGSLLVSDVKASSSAGVTIKNNSGTAVADFGTGSSTNSSIHGSINIGVDSADYIQFIGGTGNATENLVGSSTDIDKVIVPKGAGKFKVTGNANISGLTALQILATNASKDLVSLDTATYPSLTELSYVKGVTSSIQTQINSKQATLTLGTGVQTALGVNVGTAGAFVVNGGALGTPSSGTVTNLTGTASININGTVGATTPSTGAFTGISIGTLNYSPSNALITSQQSVNSYSQNIIQNTSTGATASADYIVNNSLSTDTTFYGNFGMNSSGFTGAAVFNQPSYVYLTSTSTDLAIGTTTAHGIHFVVNSGTTDAMTISSAGAVTVPGVATMSGLNVITHSSTGLIVRNPANTFSYTIAGAAIAAARTLNLPLITNTDTLVSLGLSQTFTGAITFNNASVLAGAATMAIFNTTATTITAFGAATTMTIGGTPTTAITHNYSTNATAAATTKTVNLGTGGAASSTTNINIGSANGGTTTVNSPTISLGGTTGATTTGTIELGAASDTTLARVAAGIISVEGEVMNGYATTATAAGTTTLTITSAKTQFFTGTSTQTVTLPTTSVIVGQAYRIVNNSTGNVTVQSSGANTIQILGAGMSAWFTALQATPTTAAHWSCALQSFTGQNIAQTASSNAATVNLAYVTNTITNNSAATLTITLPTAGAVDGEMRVVRVLDFSAVAQTLAWTNTENSTVTAPTTTNGSTTLPLTVGFQYNNATSKWRCIASA